MSRPNAPRAGDTKLVFYHKESFGKKATICCAWLHSHFLSQQTRTVLRRPELDKACKDKHHRFPENFEIEIHVTPHEYGQGEHRLLRVQATDAPLTRAAVTRLTVACTDCRALPVAS